MCGERAKFDRLHGTRKFSLSCLFTASNGGLARGGKAELFGARASVDLEFAHNWLIVLRLKDITRDEVSFQKGVFDAEDHLIELLNVIVCHFRHMKVEPVREKSLELL